MKPARIFSRREWDWRLGSGRQKVFEVRRIYNDIGFIDEFLTEDFARERHLFTFEYNEDESVCDRESQVSGYQAPSAVPTDQRRPVIQVSDGNHENRGELDLIHHDEGVNLDLPFAQATLNNLYTLWKRPVHIETKTAERGRMRLSHGADGIPTAPIGLAPARRSHTYD